MTKKEAIKDIQENIKPFVGGKSLDMAIEALKAEPTKHGRWETPKGYPNVLLCSECNTPYEKKEFVATPNYCPNCGARMDGGENE